VKRRGFVLAAGLLVIVLIAVLIAGVFFATMEESHIARTAASRERALNAAESAIEETIGSWGDRARQPVGVGGEQLSTFSTGDVSVDVSVIRLDSTLYSIVAQARSRSSTSAAMRRIGVILSTQNSIDRSIPIDPIPERWWLELL
jgi:Tfp pilus assembly protein PilX